MRCPFCSNDESKVTNKRDSEDSIRRRRECLKCQKRFTTHEKIESFERYVMKKDGRRERFDRNKVLVGITKACEKRKISQEDIEKIVTELEEKINISKKDVSTKKIGEFIIKRLKRLDKIAYIRFASIYLDFNNLEDFEKEIKEINTRVNNQNG
jgi:transcriptional repressor NrdR